MKTSEAIILAGGLGKRLQGIVKDIPKPMADIRGRPFLSYLLDYLLDQGIGRVIISTGHRAEAIVSTFKDSYHGLKIEFSNEEMPLGTGGAVKLAMRRVRGANVFVLNGDTIFKAGLSGLESAFLRDKADIAIALKDAPSCERYGRVVLDAKNRIVELREKGVKSGGLINAGVSLMRRGVLDKMPDAFSFEADFLCKELSSLKIVGVPFDGYFIDIGIPDDYLRAQQEL
jgi:D-glycero-alpha-D-manno-heptose 1-phosphate guanylyltransferase